MSFLHQHLANAVLEEHHFLILCVSFLVLGELLSSAVSETWTSWPWWCSLVSYCNNQDGWQSLHELNFQYEHSEGSFLSLGCFIMSLFYFWELPLWPWYTKLLNKMLIFFRFFRGHLQRILDYGLILAKNGRSSDRKISNFLYLAKYKSNKVVRPLDLSTSIAFVLQCIKLFYLQDNRKLP